MPPKTIHPRVVFNSGQNPAHGWSQMEITRDHIKCNDCAWTTDWNDNNDPHFKAALEAILVIMQEPQ